MSSIIYPQFGRQPWSDGVYTLLLHLRGTATTAASGGFDDPTYYTHFDLLMSRLSHQRYGAVPAPPGSAYLAESRDETATREKEETDRHSHLSDVMCSAEYYHDDQPHPFDLVRCQMSLLRPWPSAETSGPVGDLRWRLEVMGWYEDWPVMSTSPKVGGVVVNRVTTVSLAEMAGAEGQADLGRRERVSQLFRVGRAG
ncbi:uncharacterized protein LAJ45_01135 [Morchella importuna]|uniref:uncharacterized protein n=1 Tax=Morchella importuna TaxID=1174673 RepID=UPI001E8E4731|nr:uncharacterized protein LAJ45_01135 [Morchella importuna]KAH8154607.1 hypothetical protein LAJ45_01135 [Morchella importuna]